MNRDIEQLKVWIIKKRLQGWVITDICTSARISRDYSIDGGTATKQKTKMGSKKKAENAQRFWSYLKLVYT